MKMSFRAVTRNEVNKTRAHFTLRQKQGNLVEDYYNVKGKTTRFRCGCSIPCNQGNECTANPSIF